MNGKHAEQVPGLILKAFKGLPRKIDLHTITFDNGKEFSKHKKITLKTGVICYFATPYHSWERGLNENTNGLIRQYFPKKSNLKKFTPEDIRFVENQLNNRPRKTLGYRTPREVFLGIKYLPKILKKTRAVKHTSLVLSSENIERKGILGKRSPKYLHPPCLLSFQLKSIL